MKKILILIFATFLLTVIGCSTSSIKKTPALKKQNISVKSKIDDSDSVKTNWSNYSYGLYFKSLALSKRNFKERVKFLDIALKHFQNAGKNKIGLDRTYFQISDCLYLKKQFFKSIDFSRKAIKINPEFIKPYNLIFHTYLLLKNNKEATQIILDYLKINNKKVNLLYTLGEHYYKRVKNNKKAIESFQKIIDLSKTEAFENYYKEESYYYIGYINFREKKDNLAIKNFKKVLEINPQNHNAMYMLSILYIKRYDLKNSQFYAQKYYNFNNKNLVINFVLGVVKYINDDLGLIKNLRILKKSKSIEGYISNALYFELMQKDKKSKKILNSITKYRPNFISPHIALAKIEAREKKNFEAYNEYFLAGNIALNLKSYKLAKKLYLKALLYKKDSKDLYSYLGKIGELTNDLDFAIISYKELYNIDHNFNTSLHIGFLYGLAKNDKKANYYFLLASKINPKHSYPFYLRGLLFLSKKNYIKAEKFFQKAEKLEPKSEELYYNIAIVKDSLKKQEELIKILKKALTKYPKSSRLNNFLGYIYADKNIRIKEALSLIKLALKQDPNNAAYLDSLGWVYFRMGKFNLALENLLKAEKFLGKLKALDPVIYEHLGDTYFKIGKNEKAVFYWKKSLKIKQNKKIEEKIKQNLKKTQAINK